MPPRQDEIVTITREPLTVRGLAWLRTAAPVLILLGMLSGLYGEVLRDLVGQWWDDANYSHGFVVPLFSAFLVWKRRGALSSLTPRGSWLGLPMLLAGVGALILGDLSAENFLMRSSLIVSLAGLVLLHLGADVLRRVAFPLAFLFFMVPLPAIVFNAVAFPLQGLAAQNASWMLDLLGVPVLRDGNVIHLSHISLGVTEACSGIRSLISLLALAVAWAYLTLPWVWAMVALVASAVPVTIVANAGRVVMTGLIGQWVGVEYAQGFFHTFSGWLIFLVSFGCLLGVHGLLRLLVSSWRLLPRRPRPPASCRSQPGPGNPVTHARRVAAACMLLLGALLLLQFRSRGEAVPIRQPLDAFPTKLGDWQGREATIFEVEILNILKVKDYLLRRYVDPTGRSLWLYIGYWDTQRRGAQIHSPKNCLPGGGWEPVEAARVAIPVVGATSAIEVNRYLLQKDGDQQLVLYWYHSQGQAVAREIDAKLRLVKNAIVRNRTDAAIIRVSSPVYGSVQETFEHLVGYIQVMYPLLGHFLPD